jgi:adenylyltransferase/sulfurtransferase
MSVAIQIPTPLRRFTGEAGEVEVEASTVGEAMASLVDRYGDLKPHLYGDDGRLRSFVNLFLNEEDVRYLQREETPVADGDQLAIIPSIAGGSDNGEVPELSAGEIRRYSRHLIMPEVGTLGQRKLKAASVLMVGTGGLGSPIGMYLAAAGVGRLGLVEFDVVDESNLHRQLLFGQSDVGRPKLEAAIDRLHDINPYVELVPHAVRLDSSNAPGIIEGYDVVVDGTDNFPTRYLVNDACVLAGKPNVYGSIFRFEGQLSVFWGARGPCYRCLFPEPPPPGLVPSCAEGGVLGVLPGIIGALQANEVIKLVVGQGDPLIGRLVLFDALKLRFRELKLRKNPECPVCSERPTLTELIDYEQFCGLQEPALAAQEADEVDLTPIEVKGWQDEGRSFVLLDVRSPEERAICAIDGSTLIPVQQLPQRLAELDPGAPIVVHCHHGPRSLRAVQLLRDSGFERVWNLRGGIDAWSQEIDPSVPRY